MDVTIKATQLATNRREAFISERYDRRV